LSVARAGDSTQSLLSKSSTGSVNKSSIQQCDDDDNFDPYATDKLLEVRILKLRTYIRTTHFRLKVKFFPIIQKYLAPTAYNRLMKAT